MICPNMEEYYGTTLPVDAVSVFLRGLPPGASSLVYPFSMHARSRVEPTGAGSVDTTLAQCCIMTGRVRSVASIG